MLKISGPIKKLIGEMNTPIQYFFPIGDEKVPLNTLIGKKLSLTYLQEIFCIQCERKTAKSFQQGYCYPCYRKLLDCNLCVIHPEKCNYPKKECPDTWEHEHCKEEHIVYLANSSGLKVGITRLSQVPTRWIDQGASQAIPIFKVSNRYQSGLIEVLFKQYVADKTNWRKMLSSEVDTYDMITVKEELIQKADQELQPFFLEDTQAQQLTEPVMTLTYPILDYPKKLTSITFDKNPELSGQLLGIKGQYLLFDTGVINIRKHSGYNITLTFE